MPTGRDSAVVPLRKRTKERLAALRQDGATYDEVVWALLEAVPASVVRAQLRARTPRRALSPREQAAVWREPEKQLLMAQLAEESWRAWRRTGRVRDLGPRAVAWQVDDGSAGQEDVKIAWSRRRGLPA